MTTSTDLKRRFEFAIALRFELFYALQALSDPESRVHRRWRERVLKALPPEFDQCRRALGGTSHIWPIIADALHTAATDLSFEEIHSELKAQDIGEFQKRILTGALHDERLTRKLIDGKLSLKSVLAKVRKPKQEWLTHIRLYPYDPHEPMISAIQLIIAAPEEFRRATLRALELFWQSTFRADWIRLQRQFNRSIEEKERLFHSCSFAEFAREALLRIEVDERSQLIKAVRGGYALAFNDVARGFLMPSAFNDKRYWTAFMEDGGSIVYFPYFNPSITLDLEVARDKGQLVNPQLDPALIFKALGDTTRFAIVRIIAKRASSSIELARMLAISKPTVSHHVHVLRDAGLIAESYEHGSVWLSLKREVIEELAEMTIRVLFSDQDDCKRVVTVRQVRS